MDNLAFTREEELEFLSSKAYQCAVREEGQEHAMRYLRRLRDEADNAFSDADLVGVMEAAFEKQRQTGQNTRAFWGLAPDEPWVFMTAEDIEQSRRMTPEEKAAEAEVDFWKDSLLPTYELLRRKIEPRKPLITQNGEPVFLESSVNQVFAYRGLGKSVVALMLAKLFTQGGEWLGFKSDGKHDVLLIDGELPAAQLQERLKEFVGAGSYVDGGLRIWSPEFAEFPDFLKASPKGEIHPLGKALAALKPKVVIFDTLTRCFKIDTNDTEQCLRLNDTLIQLRQMGLCVILIHHAGKNQTQRGRTDIDDNLDVAVKLEQPYGWLPGDGLAFKWVYEKVRQGAKLEGFQASYAHGVWSVSQDERLEEVRALKKAGKTSRAIATALDMSQSAVSRMLRRITDEGLEKLNARAAYNRDSTGGGKREKPQ